MHGVTLVFQVTVFLAISSQRPATHLDRLKHGEELMTNTFIRLFLATLLALGFVACGDSDSSSSNTGGTGGEAGMGGSGGAGGAGAEGGAGGAGAEGGAGGAGAEGGAGGVGGAGGMGGAGGSMPMGLTIHLDTTCSGIENIETVVLTGPWWSWALEGDDLPVGTDEDGDGIYSMTLNDVPMDDMQYKWVINGQWEPTFVGDPAAPIGACTPIANPSEGFANRLHVAGSGDRTDTWGSCTACGEEFTPEDMVTVSLDTRCAGVDAVTSARITGPWWGWDPAGGPAGTDEDGDGIWTVTFAPAPDSTMEYLWVLNDVQEDLRAANATLTDCGAFNSDNNSYANRLFLIGQESSVDVYNSCGECAPEPPMACMADADCGEGQTCTDGVCAAAVVVAPNGCPSDCQGCFDGGVCTQTNEWWTCGEQTVCGWARVEINVDMTAYGADQAPNIQGEFNGWCGDCSNTASDPDEDGIYTFLQYLAPDNYEWKPSIGAWVTIASAPAECGTGGEDNNYQFDVAAADVNSGNTISVGPVCFADGVGSCGACEAVEPPACMADADCAEGQICDAGQCIIQPVDPPADIVSLTFDDAASVDGWTALGDAAADGATWADAQGVEGGALRIAAENAEDVGRAYIHQYSSDAINYAGNTNVEVSFAAKLGAPLVATAVHVGMAFPGIDPMTQFDIQANGLNENDWTTYTFQVNNIDANGGLFRIDFNLAAGAVVGAGGVLLIDNITVRPGAEPVEPVDPGPAANGCPNDCQGCFDGAVCTATNEWWTCGEQTVCGWARVEINVDMNDYGADQAPNIQGEFNEWCGDCSNTATDLDADGIYTFLQYLAPDNYEWKPSIGAWVTISSAPVECGTGGENNNYQFDVAAADVNSGNTVSVGPVCFADGIGSCGACAAAAVEQ